MMNIKLGSLGAIAICAFGLSGCFVFETLPFQASELKRLSDTAFADELLQLAQQDVPEEARQVIEDLNQNTPDDLAYTVSDDLIISFEEQAGGWMPKILMKNESHFMACQLIIEDDITPPDGVVLTAPVQEEITSPENINPENIFPPTIISGTEEELKNFLLDTVSSSPKICMAIPVETIPLE